MSDNSNNQLVTARSAIASVSSGKLVNQDAWMTQWSSTNWGDLLQPAPLSIALLGSILIIASSTDDLSLLTDAPEGVPAFKWEYAAHPDSFKSCLQQMVGAGYKAFETAHADMETIRNSSGQIPDVIATIVNLVLKGTADDIASLFQNSIDDLQALSSKCRDSANQCETAFKDITGLAQEMVLACTYKAGTAEQAKAQNEIHLAVLKVQKEQQETQVKEAKATADMMKNSYTKAEDEFHNAVRDVPKGWDLMGMQVVESLTSLVVTAGNAAISQATLSSRVADAGLSAFSSKTGKGQAGASPAAAATPPQPLATTSPNGVSSQPNSAALSDPGTMLAQRVLDQASAIKALLVGNDGKPDWDKIRAKDAGSTSGASYVQATLNSQKGQLDTSKPLSNQLNTYIDKALEIITAIIKSSNSVSSADDSVLNNEVNPTNTLISELQSLVTSVNLILQQPGAPATGPATPATPAAVAASGAAQLAVETAKMKVDQTKSQLEATRASFEKASDRLVQQQQDITKTIGEMTQLSLTTAGLRQMLPVLKKAVGAFTTLRAQFSQLVQFFDSVASLLVDIMVPSIDRWVKTITAAEEQRLKGEQEAHVAGVTISNFTRDLIYRQMMTPLKVSMLATQISTVYISISNDYILPAQRSVGQLLQFSNSNSAADKSALTAQLTKSQEALRKSTETASTHIKDKVAADQKKFSAAIDKRLNTIVTSVQVAIPAVAGPVPQNIKAITDAHVVDLDANKAQQAALNPIFDSDSAM